MDLNKKLSNIAAIMDANQMKALRIISSGGNGLTELAIVLIGRHAPALLSQGLIERAPRKKAAYALTKKSRDVLRGE
jgi:hypothetical protein